jgi:hypothetical protein
MDDKVREHYKIRPQIVKNSADSGPIDSEIIRDLRRLEQRIGSVCTEQDVSVTIDTNE